jgi:membrane associated rhomboid family serine protease
MTYPWETPVNCARKDRFMFVVGDEGHYHGRFPFAAVAIVALNVVVFAAQTFIGPAFTFGYSLVPEEITTLQDVEGMRYRDFKVELPGSTDAQGRPQYTTKQIPIAHYPGPTPIWLTLITSMFMHVSVVHLIGNMWFLIVFGRNVECALGLVRFLVFYLGCGVFAGLAHVASDPHSIVPCLGASGAISGVMGAYVAIHPLNKVVLWVVVGAMELPALVVVGLWALAQYLAAFALLETGLSDGVAYWDHLGGFCAGLLGIRSLVLWLRLWPRRESAPQAVPPSDLGKAAKPGEADPYGRFLTVQVLRAMQEKPR